MSLSHREKVLSFALIVALVAAGILLFVSSPLQPAQPQAHDSPTRPIRLGGAPAYELILPTLSAIANGYFQDEGLHVTEFIFGPGSNTRTALLRGDLDAALLAFVHVPLARARGLPLKIVCGIYDREIFSVVVRSELRDEIRTLADLKDHRIGVASVGSGNWAAVSSYLAKAGLDPEKDVEFIIVGNNLQTVYNSLKSGLIDAYPSFEPQTTSLLADDVAFTLLPIWESDAHRRWVGQSAMAMVLAVREETTEDDPELVQRLVNVQKLGLLFVRTHSSQEIADTLLQSEIVSSYLGDIDREILVSALEKIKANYGIGALDRNAYETQLRVYVDRGVLPEPVPFDEAVDWRFAGLSP